MIHNNAARQAADLLDAPAARTNPNHKAGRNVIAERLRDGGTIENEETSIVAEIDGLTFRCADCGLPVLIDELDLPEESEIVTCYGCGKQFGTFTEVKKAMIEMRKSEIAKAGSRRPG